MKLGIIGTQYSGKTSLFNALTRLNIDTGGYHKNEMHIGVVKVPDKRVDELGRIYQSKKLTYASIEFVDMAMVHEIKTSREQNIAHKLGWLKEMDALIQVIRCFEDPSIGLSGIAPEKEIEDITLELILADIESIDRRIERIEKPAKSGDDKLKHQIIVLEELRNMLNNNIPIRNKDTTPVEKQLINELQLLTAKQILYVLNIHEQDIPNSTRFIDMVRKKLINNNVKIITICAKIEAELAQLDNDDEYKEYMEELGINESGLNKLINNAYSMLDLITFFTCNEKEVRAHPVSKGITAHKAAGKVHSDIERGFIRAEVIKYDDLIALGSETEVKNRGLFKVEGKDYHVQDGDILYFRFNV
jgi:hypothetical protein